VTVGTENALSLCTALAAIVASTDTIQAKHLVRQHLAEAVPAEAGCSMTPYAKKQEI
jgi:hypothetical protein